MNFITRFRHSKSKGDSAHYDFEIIEAPLRLLNIRRAGTRPDKHALLSYLDVSIKQYLKHQPTSRFSNDGLAIGWLKVLLQLGYSVDVINWADTTFNFAHKYDLVVSHGGVNFEQLHKQLAADVPYIYFSTGNYWKFHNQQEEKRFADFQQRHGVSLPPDRYINFPEETANKRADGIVVLGDASMRDVYPFPHVFTINNGSFPDDHFDKINKDYKKTKQNFLFFAGSGNVHKGLDLLIDAFKELDQNLYIVTRLEGKIAAVFKNDLNLPNIHAVGEVNMRTAEFYEVMDKCAFAILPSCSEGQAGSVVECMNQGLIPIVSQETRLDTEDFGFTLKTSSIEEIKSVVSQAASLSPEEVRKRAQRTRTSAVHDYSPGAFENNLKRDVQTILKLKEAA